MIERLKRTLTFAQIDTLTAAKAELLLTPDERHIFGTEHITFEVNVPVELTVVRDTALGAAPFWLTEAGFENTGVKWKEGADEYEAWRKNFVAGPVGLGVNSLRGGGNHYFVALKPRSPEVTLSVTNLYPGQLRVTNLVTGVKPCVDDDSTLTNVPHALLGQTLIQTVFKSRNDADVTGVLTVSARPSKAHPDHVLLTWSADPRTTQSIQWRTSTRIKNGLVAYQKKSSPAHPELYPTLRVRAFTTRIKSPTVVNDPIIQWHTATLTGLEPDTTYLYSVGDGSRDGWSRMAEFTTAPAGVKSFSFAYMGDAQNGLYRWGSLVRNSFRDHPEAAFYIMAGDLVNRGAQRDDWDDLFYNARGVYDHRQLVPVIGNHECQGGQPSLYLNFFNLPRNGPTNVEPERAYSFEYSNALFVVLDSNLEPETQSAWLEDKLANTKAKWKFVTYHHPAYSSMITRDNKKVRDTWTPIFDKYHVDLALQGHDHAYLRTFPMKDQKRVASAKEGTIYIVSVSGTKHNEQGPHDYTEKGFAKLSTYQVLDVQVTGDKLLYRAYDIDGKVRDEFVIEK
jgi:hypothetical protein